MKNCGTCECYLADEGEHDDGSLGHCRRRPGPSFNYPQVSLHLWCGDYMAKPLMPLWIAAVATALVGALVIAVVLFIVEAVT